MKITILGARGSVPTDGPDMVAFGGATSCIMAESDNSILFLDAGSGITAATATQNKPVNILITHPHADHLLGLPFFPDLSKKGRKFDIYATVKDGLGTYDQVSKFFSAPLWPARIDDYPADVSCHDLPSHMCKENQVVRIGDFNVSAMESNHPGGSTIFRIENNGSSFVYATDYEHSEDKDGELIRFCRGTDLLLYDGQYTDEEYEKKRTFGHSTPKHGEYIMHKCEAHMLRIVHHDPHHDDETLEKMERTIVGENKAFARQGEIICLQAT